MGGLELVASFQRDLRSAQMNALSTVRPTLTLVADFSRHESRRSFVRSFLLSQSQSSRKGERGDGLRSELHSMEQNGMEAVICIS